jgi:ankyrin repeat protein
VLKDIKKQNQGHARRLLQCLVVAIRPLRIEELAEVLAVDFDDAEGIPKLKPDWRWEDHEQALLTSCSSLIAIVKTDDSRVVQFSHFSVKEFLTSARLSTSSGDVSRYHIDLGPAHTILAQACLSILLESVDRVEENDVEKSSPLAEYAAQNWAIHAQFKEVSSCLRKAMGYLFDPDKPYFAAWLQLHDIDSNPERRDTSLYMFTENSKSDASPLYYAALCGFQDLVEDIVIKCPQDVNASSGYYVTPLVAALAGGHSQTANYLYDHGGHLNIPGNAQRTPLHSAAWYGDFEMVQVFLGYKADINARSDDNWTSLHEASEGDYSSQNIPRLPDVARLLLERGADVNVLDGHNVTPLHLAAKHGRVGVVRVLLEHGANVGAEDEKGSTPLHAAAEGRFESTENERAEVVSVLLEHGANVGAKDNYGRTPFQIASAKGYDMIVKLLVPSNGLS